MKSVMTDLEGTAVGLLRKLGYALFGPITPVAPFINDIVQGLASDPSNYALTVDPGRAMVFRQLRGMLADNGLEVTFALVKGKPTVTVSNYIFDIIPVNFKEAQLLAFAAENWCKGLAADLPGTLVGKRSYYFSRSH